MRSGARSSVVKTVPAEYAPRQISSALYNLQLLANPPGLDLSLNTSLLYFICDCFPSKSQSSRAIEVAKKFTMVKVDQKAVLSKTVPSSPIEQCLHP